MNNCGRREELHGLFHFETGKSHEHLWKSKQTLLFTEYLERLIKKLIKLVVKNLSVSRNKLTGEACKNTLSSSLIFVKTFIDISVLDFDAIFYGIEYEL